MELVPWLIFAAIALFFDVAMGRAKRKAESGEHETRRAEAWQEYGQEIEIETEDPYPEELYEELYTDRSYSERHPYQDGSNVLESPAPVEIPTYDADDRRPVVPEVRESVVRLIPGEGRQLGEPREELMGALMREHTRDLARDSAHVSPREFSRMRRREETQITVPSRTPRMLTLNPVTARQAIVWMEVLGVPKGLRP